jgi:hypothetical protein
MTQQERNALAKKDIRLKAYFAGACLSNVPLWVLTFTFSYVQAASMRTFFLLASYISTFAVAILAGFLTAKKLSRKDAKTGLVTGLLSYVVCVLSIVLLYGNVLLLFEGGADDLLLILDFVSGNILGSLLRRASPFK